MRFEEGNTRQCICVYLFPSQRRPVYFCSVYFLRRSSPTPQLSLSETALPRQTNQALPMHLLQLRGLNGEENANKSIHALCTRSTQDFQTHRDRPSDAPTPPPPPSALEQPPPTCPSYPAGPSYRAPTSLPARLLPRTYGGLVRERRALAYSEERIEKKDALPRPRGQVSMETARELAGFLVNEIRLRVVTS